LESAKRGLIVGAAGFHNILMHGRPGGGKTVLARAFRNILPRLSMTEAIEVANIYSIVEGITANARISSKRPFREIHHTASKIAIIGGGSNLKPGEITLAHKGVLFMDEINEFSKDTLDVLRQPMEDGFIKINRLKYSTVLPSEFILMAAMNDCPCGAKDCKCTRKQILNYRNKISGPILDRMDIFMEIPRISLKNFWDEQAKKEEFLIRQKIMEASEIQIKRSGKPNSRLSAEEIKEFCIMTGKAKSIMELATDKFDLSNRGYLKTIKVARTIADLMQKKEIDEDAVLEALQYRLKSNFITND